MVIPDGRPGHTLPTPCPHPPTNSQVQTEVRGRGISGLVNNAGKVTLAPVEFMPIQTFEDQLQVAAS